MEATRKITGFIIDSGRRLKPSTGQNCLALPSGSNDVKDVKVLENVLAEKIALSCLFRDYIGKSSMPLERRMYYECRLFELETSIRALEEKIRA